MRPKDYPGCYRECHSGWDKIIDEALLALQKESDRSGIHLRVTQIKEKYGSLRIYLALENDEMSKIIRKAEKASESTCEICGNPGKIIAVRRWCRCRCETCKEENEVD